MAFYKVIVDGKQYVNQHLCRVANRLGDAGIMRAVGKGEFLQKQLFDSVLFSVEPLFTERYDALGKQVSVQNVDDDIKALKKITDDDKKIKRIVMPMNGIETFKYKGFMFVRFSDITDVYKYRKQAKMATLHVCGYIYVALNAVIETEKKPIVVAIE